MDLPHVRAQLAHPRAGAHRLHRRRRPSSGPCFAFSVVVTASSSRRCSAPRPQNPSTDPGKMSAATHHFTDTQLSVRERRMVLTHLYHPSGNLFSHHAVMMDGAGEWHYKCAFEDRLHERLAGPSRSGSDAQGVVDRLLGRFGTGRLAHVQGAPVGAAEGGGDALLAFEDAP